MEFDDELRQLTPDEGLQSLNPPPCDEVVFSAPPTREREAEAQKYLWVVSPESVPFALELLPDITFKRGRLAHTNLTAGKDAHCAGEVWFTNSNSLVLNGGSGRYRPRSPEELDLVAKAFKDSGYRVASMGWDTVVDAPARIVRGDLRWL